MVSINSSNKTNTVDSSDSDPAPAKEKEAKQTPQNRPWYKQAKYIVGLSSLAVGIVSITIGLIYRNNVINNRTAIEDGWYVITQQADKLVRIGEKITTPDTFADYTNELDSLVRLVGDQKYKSERLAKSLTNKTELNNWDKFLDQFDNYVRDANQKSETVSEFDEDDYNELKELAAKASAASNDFKDNSKFVDQTMPNEVFEIYSVLERVKETIDTKKEEEAAAKQKQAEASAQESVNKATSERNVTTFQGAYIAADAAKMRSVMSSGFASEYDFTQITPENRQYSYPESFRIIDSAKVGEAFSVRVNTVYRNRDDSGVTTGQYTQGSTFTVINSNNNWLINSEKREGAY